MSDTLKAGDLAPDFELMNQDKNKVRLSDYRGKRKVMLLFYPMDFSPVCTQEHCTFGPQVDRLRKDEETVVFGVNADHPFAHAAFRKAYDIPYDLLSDPTRKTLKAYGMFAGEEPYNCAKRGTVVVGKDGRISFYEVSEMREARTVESLERASLVELAMEQRANEFGEQAGGTQSR